MAIREQEIKQLLKNKKSNNYKRTRNQTVGFGDGQIVCQK